MENNSVMVRFILIASLLAVAGCGKKNNPDENGKKEKTLIPVEVAVAGNGDIAAFFNGTATLEAEDDAQVVAKVGGVVEEILVEEGDRVAAGAVLARLDGEVLQVQLAQAEANLRRLEEDFNRKSTLYRKDAISIDIFQQAKYEYESQKAARGLVQLSLDYTAIKAPIDGIVTGRQIKVGNMVLTNATAFRITDFDPLLAVLYVPEREIGKLAVGQRAAVMVDALPGREFPGAIDRISPVVDPRTGTVKVTLEVSDTTSQLKAGMFARVSIVYDQHQNSLLIPRDAIIAEDAEAAVYVIRDTLAFRQVVTSGYVNTTHIEITAGLNPGDTVVVTGQGSLSDSARVEIIAN
ncbi:MAG: efflux RND transporter periplasmic adaptor subunit [Candidatus Neomarinimicrobiota bacterium]